MRQRQLNVVQLQALRFLDVTPTRPGERAFVASASGLCQVADRLYVVADEEHTLAVFPATGSAPGSRHVLLLPEAQDHSPMPKRYKPDLEALCALPEGTLLCSRNALSRDFSEIITLIEQGRIDTRPWITHRTGFDELIGVFDSYTRPETGVIKAVVEVGE